MSYTKSILPELGNLGLIDIHSGEFKRLTETRALNWQLGSRVQWLSDSKIIYNDVDDGLHCSKIFELKSKKVVKKINRAFWAISPDKKIAASLNFNRIAQKRPGYGYSGESIDERSEMITLTSIENGNEIFTITLKEI